MPEPSRSKPVAVSVHRDEDDLVVRLADGRAVRVPLRWVPTLGEGADAIQLNADGTRLDGPDLERFTVESLLESPPLAELEREMQWFFDHPREGWILEPQLPTRLLSSWETKMGGAPHCGELQARPVCPRCSEPMGFVLQLERARFPGMWFPPDKDLFQVFRCSGTCSPYDQASDTPMWLGFVRVDRGVNQPSIARENDLPERELTATRILDYPSFYEGREAWWGDRWVRFQDRWGDGDNSAWFFGGVHWNRIPNKKGIKAAGLPSWTQVGYPPTCGCGQKKTFIFQLASTSKAGIDIQIGDVGNVYCFVCETCGERSLETSWDCY